MTADEDGGQPAGEYQQLNNPMRFSLGNRTIPVEKFNVEITEIEVRVDEGNIYAYWEEPDYDGGNR